MLDCGNVTAAADPIPRYADVKFVFGTEVDYHWLPSIRIDSVEVAL